MAENNILLEIKDLHANVGDKEILRGIDLTVREGETHAITRSWAPTVPANPPYRQS